jgi:hypothetical protein
MSAFAGSALNLQWVYSGGTVQLETDFRNFGWTPSLNFIDATAGADTYEELLASYGTGVEIPVTMVLQADGTALLAALDRQTAGTLIYGPEGTANGKPKYTIPATSSGPQFSQPFDDIVEITANFRQTAAEQRATF